MLLFFEMRYFYLLLCCMHGFSPIGLLLFGCSLHSVLLFIVAFHVITDFQFLADGRAFATVLRLSSDCDVMYCG